MSGVSEPQLLGVRMQLLSVRQRGKLGQKLGGSDLESREEGPGATRHGLLLGAQEPGCKQQQEGRAFLGPRAAPGAGVSEDLRAAPPGGGRAA